MNSPPSVAESATRRWLRGSYAGLLLLIGLTLVVGGVLLLIDGGSFYYLLAGLAISSSAILVGRRDLRGRWLYGALLIATVAWAMDMPSLRAPPLREEDTWGISPIDQMMCRILFKRSRYDGEFTPPTLDKPIVYTPGFGGGAEWGGVAVDIDRGILIVNWNRYASRVELITRAEAQARGFKRFDGHGQGNEKQPMENTPYAAQADVTFRSPLQIPCTAPPWGLLTAIDVVSGKVVWNERLGTGRDSGFWYPVRGAVHNGRSQHRGTDHDP